MKNNTKLALAGVVIAAGLGYGFLSNSCPGTVENDTSSAITVVVDGNSYRIPAGQKSQKFEKLMDWQLINGNYQYNIHKRTCSDKVYYTVNEITSGQLGSYSNFDVTEKSITGSYSRSKDPDTFIPMETY